MKKHTLLLILSLIPVFVFSQISFLAENRPRFYFDNGYKNPDVAFSDAMVYLTQRSGIACQYQNKNITAYIHIRDVRVWGDDNLYSSTGQSGNSNSMALHQSWIELHTKQNLALKVGRQLLVYDDERLLSARNWNDFQVTYDAIKVNYSHKNSTFDAVFSWNNLNKASVYFPARRIKSTNLIHYQYQNGKSDFSALFLTSGKTAHDTSSTIIWKKTIGTGYSYQTDKWLFDINLYLQNSLTTPDYCVALLTERKSGNWRIAAGVDILSGAKSNTGGFDILYGKRHGYYGYMDYFNTTPKNGLIDIMAKASWNQSDKMLLSLNLHNFSYQQNAEDVALNRALGQELDFTMKYQFTKEVSIQPGYSFYLPTKTFEVEKNSISGLGIQHFFYLTMSGKFKSEK
jgi:hypothetical protein